MFEAGATGNTASKQSAENGILSQILSNNHQINPSTGGGNLPAAPVGQFSRSPQAFSVITSATTMNSHGGYYMDGSRRVPGSPDALVADIHPAYTPNNNSVSQWNFADNQTYHSNQIFEPVNFCSSAVHASQDPNQRRSSQPSLSFSSNAGHPHPRMPTDSSSAKLDYIQLNDVPRISQENSFTLTNSLDFQNRSANRGDNNGVMPSGNANMQRIPQPYDGTAGWSASSKCDPGIFGSGDDLGWTVRHPVAWSIYDTQNWLHSVAAEYKLNPNSQIFEPYRNVNGPTLVKMDWADFVSRDPINGNLFFFALEKIVRQTTGDLAIKLEPMDIQGLDHHIPLLSMTSATTENFTDMSAYLQDPYTTDEFDDIPDGTIISLPSAQQQQHQQQQNLPLHQQSHNNFVSNFGPCFPDSSRSNGVMEIKYDLDSDGDSNRSSSVTFTSLSPQADWSQSLFVETSKRSKPVRGDKSKGGRNKQGTRGNHLWEFIRDLLKNKENAALIRWEDRAEGVFRLVDSDKVARMWGEKKSNSRMTYEKLSRAMRYYYKSEILEAVPGRRLVYKFGAKATGWRNVSDG